MEPTRYVLRVPARRTGVPLLSYHMAGWRTTASTVWLVGGTRDEAAPGLGATHLLEHCLLSASCPERTGATLLDLVGAAGGQANAVTSHENLMAHVESCNDGAQACLRHLLEAVVAGDVSDAVVEQERAVVRHELMAARADPADRAQEVFQERLYADHPLGWPVGGAPDGVRGVDAERLRALRSRLAHAGGVAVVVAGGAPPEQLLSADVIATLERLPQHGWQPRRTAPPAPDPVADFGVGGNGAGYTYVVVGGLAASYREPAAPFSVLSALLGGLPTSRLYRELRGRGLAYHLYAWATPYSDTGLWRVLAGTEPGEAGTIVRLVDEHLRRVAEGGLDSRELQTARLQAHAMLCKDLDDPLEAATLIGRHRAVGGAEDWQPPVAAAALQEVPASALAEAAGRVLSTLTVAACSG